MNAPKGFARFTPEQRKAIAQKGGQAAQASGKAHRWTAAEATEAGRKGGAETHVRRRARKALGD